MSMDYEQEVRNIQKLKISDAEKARRMRVLAIEKDKPNHSAPVRAAAAPSPAPKAPENSNATAALSQKVKEIQLNQQLDPKTKMQQIQNVVNEFNKNYKKPALNANTKPAVVIPNVKPTSEQAKVHAQMKEMADAFMKQRNDIMNSALTQQDKAAKMVEAGKAFSERQRKLLADNKLLPSK